MCKGQRPIGAAKGKQTNTRALCQTSPATDSKMVVRNNGFCGRQRRRKFCFRHTAGVIFFCFTLCVSRQNTQNFVKEFKNG